MSEEQTPQQKYTLAVQTLIASQNLLISYSISDILSSVIWAWVYVMLAVNLTLSSHTWVAALMIIFVGFYIHVAVKEYDFLKILKTDLEVLKDIELLNEERNNLKNEEQQEAK